MWLLELSGKADIATSALLRQELALVAATNRADAVVDVTSLTFCDVSSAHMILTVRRSRPLTVCGATGSVKRVFDLMDALRMQRLPRYLASSRAGAALTPRSTAPGVMTRAHTTPTAHGRDEVAAVRSSPDE